LLPPRQTRPELLPAGEKERTQRASALPAPALPYGW